MRRFPALFLMLSATDGALNLLTHQQHALWGSKMLLVGGCAGFAAARLVDYLRR